MLRFTAWLKPYIPVTALVRYAAAGAIVGCALALVSLLLQMSFRDPVGLIFLAAVALSFWYAQAGPGIFAFSLSLVCVLAYFRLIEHQWLRVARYDLPIVCLYVLFSWWIYLFTKSRRDSERVLKKHKEDLEAIVRERTMELHRINGEYKTILDAAPFGIALIRQGRIVERCNPAYEKMLGYGPDEILGQEAPLPEDQRDSWKQLEDSVRNGQSIVDHQVSRLRRDGSRFSATIWLRPLHDCNGEYIGAVGFILDSTERDAREAERQMLATLAECSPDLVAVTNLEAKLVFINAAGRRLLNFSTNANLNEIDLTELCRWKKQKDSVTPPSLPSTQDAPFETEISFNSTDKDKEVRLRCIWFTIPPASAGQESLLALVAQDISERKEAETKLRQSLDENRRLLDENRSLQEKLQRENISLQEQNLALQSEIAEIQKSKFEKIIGESPAIRRTLSKIEQVAMTDATVLITGETGTGKELIAQAIHENSKRAGMPFRAINCAALPTTLMAAELFGHEKGAFTGADRLRLGQFELANGGTLFLDEIAEIPMETQAILLRVLEERSFERLGGTKLIASDVRIIVATNRDLQVAMQRNEFRQDLFFRLNGFPIEVPPLRERKEDIPLLVQYFVEISSARHGKKIRNIEKRTMEMLRAYSWPGNVRQLRNLIDTSVIISPGENLVIAEALLSEISMTNDLGSGTLETKLAQYERSLIERALTQAHGRVSGPAGAATLLGVPGSTLTARIRVLKIDVSKFKTLGSN